MSTVLRELVAKLGFQVDRSGFDAASKGVEKIKREVGAMEGKVHGARRGMAGLGESAHKAGEHAEHAGEGFEKLVKGLIGVAEFVGFEEIIRKTLELADEAESTKTVLDTVFGEEGGKAIEAWSQTAGDALGRSKHDLAAAAASIGSLIEPMVGSAEKAQEMSEKLTELGVDLGSFFGTSDQEAIEALRGGMAGMGRSLKRYGIILDDTTLQEYAHKQGIQEKVSEMNQAEKAELTYGFLLARTSKFQGDAHKSAGNFANSTKRLKGEIKNLAVDIGTRLLPVAAKLLTGFGKLVTGFAAFADKSHIVEAALAVLTVGFAAMKWEAMAALAGPLIGFGLLALVLDEIATTLSGGKSLIRDWLESWIGVEKTDKLLHSIKSAIDGIGDGMPDIIGSWELMQGAIDDVGVAIQGVIEEMGRLAMTPVFKVMQLLHATDKGQEKFFDSARKKLGIKQTPEEYARTHDTQSHWYDDDQTERPTLATGRGLGAGGVHKLSNQIALRRREREDRIRAETEARRAANKQAGLDKIQSRDPNAGNATAPIADAGMSVAPSASAPISSSAPSSSVTNVTNITNGPINMSVGPGADNASAARAGARAAQAERRATHAAIKRGG